MPLPQLRLPRKRLPIQPVPVAHRRNGVLRGLRGRPVQRDRTEPAALPGAHRRHQMVKKNTVAARRERVTGVGFTFCILTSYSFAVFSMTIHPNKLLVATGQTAGHDNREGKVNDKRLFFSSCHVAGGEFDGGRFLGKSLGGGYWSLGPS